MKYFLPVIPGVAVGILLSLSLYGGLFRGLENFFEDVLFSPREMRSDVAIVAIDDGALAAFGQWPWPRARLAGLIEQLNQAGVAAIGLDILLAEPSRFGERDDEQLAKALNTSTVRVVLPVEASPLFIRDGRGVADTLIETHTEFLSAPYAVRGHINLIRDRDGLVRRVPLSIDGPGGAVIPAFSAATVGIKKLREQDHAIERIVFAGAPGTVPTYSVTDIFQDVGLRTSLSGKYVFIGATAASLHDEAVTPISRGQAMSGVELQAQIANMILSGYRLRPLGGPQETVWIFSLALVASLLFVKIRRLSLATVGTFAFVFLNFIAIILLFEKGTVVNLVHTTLALALGGVGAFTLRYFVLEREKRTIRNAFSKYVAKDVLEELLGDTSKLALGGEEREVTVLFSDVRGFTTLSESLSPKALTQFLNRYLTAMTDIILAHRGVVDKYIGDAIMAFWGAPLQNPNHALEAVLASLDMLEALERFNTEGVERGEPPIAIGIGLNTGDVVIGNMGSRERFDYTIMGDAVNLGSRVEGQTKTYDVPFLVTEATARAVTERACREHNILMREVDRVTVKGKTQPVALFEIVPRGREDVVRAIIDDFNNLREHYYKGAWTAAREAAERVLAKLPKDGPARVLLERIEHFLVEPPTEWHGVYELKSK